MRPYFPALDGLRTISVFLVISEHTKGPAGWLRLFPGWLGVDVFFALSGFLITVLLLKEEQARDRISLSAFYLRRVFRIIPVYLVVLTVYVGLNAHRGGPNWIAFKHGLPFYLSFLNEYVSAPFDFTWTLGIEEKFYLLWPLLAFVLFPKRRLWLVGLVYGLLLAVLPWAYQTARSYSGLVLGCGLAVLWNGRYGPRLKAAVAALPVAVPVGVVLVSAAITTSHPNGVFFFEPAILLLITHVLVKRSVFGSLLASRGFTWIGKRTYSMYLVHGLGLGWIESHVTATNAWTHLGVTLAAMAAALAIAQGLYLAVEEPSRRYGKQVIHSRREHVLQDEERIRAGSPG